MILKTLVFITSLKKFKMRTPAKNSNRETRQLFSPFNTHPMYWLTHWKNSHFTRSQIFMISLLPQIIAVKYYWARRGCCVGLAIVINFFSLGLPLDVWVFYDAGSAARVLSWPRVLQKHAQVIEKSTKKNLSAALQRRPTRIPPASSHQNAVYWMKISNTFFKGERRS